jgi:hypothetical protein
VGGFAVEPGGGYALVDAGWAHAVKILRIRSAAKIVFVFIFSSISFHILTKNNYARYQI